ncbi:MAG: glutathione S-transferase family protein [Candidatus Binatia bacterium]|nr:glutathione S-transferase family protein [Candidatus Binatia bacterium]
MPNVTLYQFAISPFCDKVRRVLAYKNVPFDIYEWPLAEVPRIQERNPTGKLPFIEWDGEVIADSTDIALAVEERVPEPRLIPQDPRERALVLALEDWADESLYFYEMCLRFGEEDFEHTFAKLAAGIPEEMRSTMAPLIRENFRQVTSTQGVGRKSQGQLAQDVERLFTAIEALQESTGFVVGNNLTLADIAIVCQAECIADSRLGAATLARHPRLAEYFARVDNLTRAQRV